MAKKQHSAPRPQPQQAPKAAPTTAAKVVAANEDGFVKKYLSLLILACISIVTFLVYKGSFENQFTNWDDLGYVLTNPFIKDSSSEGFWRLFSRDSPVMGNYHPFTMVTYWWEYAQHGLEPYYYHFDSVMLHIVATFTAFLFVRVLTRSAVAAGIAALLFAVHPMRVESVTWIAGRKDILYGMFYLLAATTHVLYLRVERSKKAIWFIATIILFFTSLMCKSVGVTLPVVLLLVDLYERRKPSVMMIVEKLPLFALSIIFGLLSIEAQKDVGALGTLDVKFNALERLALGCYSFITYIWKMIAPVGMTNFYPYPLKEQESLPGSFYIYPLIVACLIFAIWKFGRKDRLLLLGFSFFVINLLLLLQFIPVGGAVMSDRYTYIPYLGLFMVIGGWLSGMLEAGKPIAKTAIAALVGVSLVYGYMTNERNKDWYDSISLWNDAIEKNPDSPIPYFYLGQEYYTRFEKSLTAQEKQKNGDSALYNFNRSIEHKPDYTNPIVCVGEYLRSIGRFDESKAQYLKALAVDDKIESAYLGLGVIYAIKQNYDSSGIMFRKALSLKKHFPEGHANYANFLEITGKTDSALIEYQEAIRQNPDAYIPYMNRGKIYARLTKYDLAIKDYQVASAIMPENPDPYAQMAQLYLQMGNKPKAKEMADQAKSRGAQIAPEFYQQLM